MITVYESTEIEELNKYIEQLSWSTLWYGDLKEAGIERFFLAFEDDGDEVVGFQTVSGDGLCVAIETKDAFTGKGVARSLIEESNCWRPEQNECPGFWARIAEDFE